MISDEASARARSPPQLRNHSRKLLAAGFAFPEMMLEIDVTAVAHE
jgi:hypothetical protein